MSEQAPKGNVKNPAIRRIHAVSECTQQMTEEMCMFILCQGNRKAQAKDFSLTPLPPIPTPRMGVQDIRELQKEPSDQYHAAPLEVGVQN